MLQRAAGEGLSGVVSREDVVRGLQPFEREQTQHATLQEDRDMRTRQLTLPAIALIAGTRAALGAGLGMLVSGQIDRRTRRGAGWALVAIGALTTVPIAIAILRRPRRPFWRA